MTKTVKTALLIALVLIIAGAMLISVALLRGASIQDLWHADGLSFGVISTGFGDLKDYTVCETGEESFSPDEVKKIDLGWISGTVKLETGGSRIELRERSERPLKDEQKLCWKLDRGTLYIRFCKAARTQMGDKNLVLTVPAGWTAESLSVAATSAAIELRGMKAEGVLAAVATSGEVRLIDCSCRTLTAGSTSGTVTMENCRCEDLDAGSTSGGISLRGCETRDLRLGSTSGALLAEGCVCDSFKAGSTSGDISVHCEAKSIKLGATSGAIRCEAVPAGCDVSIDTNSGTVRLSLRDTADDQRIEVETTSGDVYLDLPGAMDLDFDTTSGKMHGRLEQGGSGCPHVEIDTTSGDLNLGAFD